LIAEHPEEFERLVMEGGGMEEDDEEGEEYEGEEGE